MQTNTALATYQDFEEVPTETDARNTGFATHMDDQPIEGGFNPDYGNVTWRTLICSDRTESNGLVLGVADLAPNGVLHLHRHAPPEFYFCLTGSGTVFLDGRELAFSPGVAVYIPGDVEHGVVAGPSGLSFSYGFGVDAFSDVEYRFSNARANGQA